MIYFVTLLIILLLSVTMKSTRRKQFLIITAVILILLSGLRSTYVGADSWNYYHLFRVTADGAKTSLYAKSPLFHYLMLVISKLFGSSTVTYFTFTSAMVVVPIWAAIYIEEINCKSAVILFYLLFFQSSLNGTRTYIAIAFTLFGYVLFRKKELKYKFGAAISFIIAFSIHRIAIIGLLILFISMIKLEIKRNRRIVITLIIIMTLSLNFFIRMFTIFFDAYSNTLETVTDTVGASAVVLQAIMIISLVQTYYLIRIHKDRQMTINQGNFDNLSIILFSEVMLFIACGRTWYGNRILGFLEIFIILVFPIINNVSNKYSQIYRMLIYTIAMFLFAYGTIRNLNAIMPYEFFWQSRFV